MMGRGNVALVTPGMLRTLLVACGCMLLFAGINQKSLRDQSLRTYQLVPVPVVTAGEGRLNVSGFTAVYGGSTFGSRVLELGHMPLELKIVPPSGKSWYVTWTWTKRHAAMRQPYQILRHGFVSADDVGEAIIPSGLSTTMLFDPLSESDRPDYLTVMVSEIVVQTADGKGVVTLEPTTYYFSVR